jgi:uncharacterized protein (TIRG00374 family)
MNESRNRRKLKTTLLIVVGIALGIVFFYLAFKGITWTDLVDGISTMNPIYLVHAIILLVTVQIVRALRFKLIISPFCQLSLKDNWDLINIWGGLNMIMPARLAEFVKPYLLHRRGASFSSGFGAVMVERYFDMSALLTLLALVLWINPNLPTHYKWTGRILFVVLIISYGMVLLVLTRRDAALAIVDRLLAILPERTGSFLGGVIHKLLDGFLIMASAKQALLLFVYSLFIWLLFSAMTYIFLVAFNVEVPFLVAITIQVLLCLGVALPAAPGFVGIFHAVCRYALQLFGVGAVVAISFATVYHLYTVIASLILAGISYYTSQFRFDRSVMDLADSTENGSENELTGIAPIK